MALGCSFTELPVLCPFLWKIKGKVFYWVVALFVCFGAGGGFCFENIKGDRECKAIVLFLLFSHFPLALVARNCICFSTLHVSLIQLSNPWLFTFHISVVSGFQFPVKYLILNVEIEIPFWMWDTENQKKSADLSYQHQCLLLYSLYSLSSVIPVPNCLSSTYFKILFFLTLYVFCPLLT